MTVSSEGPLRKASASRGRSVTRTVRIDEDVDRMLQEFSEREKVSINQLVGRALRRYVEWEVHAEKFGVISVGSKMLEKLFTGLTEEEARAMGRDDGNNAGVEFITFYFKKFNYENVLRATDLLGHTYARMYMFERSSERDTDTLVLKHSRGRNTSAYLAESMKAVLAKLGLENRILETEDQVVIKVFTRQKTDPTGMTRTK